MDWDSVLVEPVREMLTRIFEFAPRLGAAVILLLVGLTLAKVLESLVVRGLKIVQLDLLSEKVKISDFLMRGGITMTFSELIGAFVYWLTLLLTFITALNVLDLMVAAELFNRVVAYLPSVIAGIFIFSVGIFFASFLNAAVRTAASNAGFQQANFLGQVVQIVILIFTGIMVLQQLQFHILLLQQTLLIFIASLGLGLAIAIGLGSKELVGDLIKEIVDRMRSGRSGRSGRSRSS